MVSSLTPIEPTDAEELVDVLVRQEYAAELALEYLLLHHRDVVARGLEAALNDGRLVVTLDAEWRLE